MSKSFLTLSFSPEQNFIYAQWLRPVSSQEYRHGIRMIAVCVTTLKAELALTDFSKIGTPPLDDQSCTANFLKTALQNTSLKRCARVLSDQSTQLEAYQRIMQEAASLPYTTNGFSSAEAAKAWLFEHENDVALEHLYHISMETTSQHLRTVFQKFASKAGIADTTLAIKKGEEVLKTGLDVVCNTEFLNVSIDSCNSLLAFRWLKQVESADYKYGIQTLCSTLSEHKLEKVMINNQRLGAISLPDQSWLSNKIIEVISGNNLKRMAVITSKDSLQLLVNEAVDKKVKSKNNLYDPSYFFSEDEAMEWLMLQEHYKRQN